MEQLELREYNREEIAKAMDVKFPNKNFKRDIETKLRNSGYEWTIKHGGPIIITKRPETARERLIEVMYRKFGIDVQVSVNDFICFLDNIFTFKSMPWSSRREDIQETFQRDVDAQRMSRWTKHLLQSNTIVKTPRGYGKWWKTHYDNGMKEQAPVSEGEMSDVNEYLQMRSVLHKEYIDKGYDSARAWKATYEDLWEMFHCCYYQVGAINYNVLNEEEIQKIVAWVQEALCELPDPPREEVSTWVDPRYDF